ncbi:MAG: TadE/TadG family type IV pilus assembly protein [Hyphomicrobiales bacterium]
MTERPRRFSLAKFKRFRRADSGVAAIEFAMVGLPFLWLLCATFETGLVLIAEYTIENGTQQAGRMIRTGQVQTQGLTQAKFKDIVCSGLATTMLDCKNNLYVDVRSFPSFSAVSLPPPVVNGQLSPAATTNSSYQPGTPLQVVVVRTYYNWKLFTPGISKLANLGSTSRLLASSTSFRNEPYAIQ